MTATAQDVSQETPLLDEAETRFLQAWKDGVDIAGTPLFSCQARNVKEASHWHQLTPKLDVIRRAIPNKSQADAVFAATMACFYNAAEGHKLLKKVECESFGNIATLLDHRRRAILAVMLANFPGW